MTDPDGKIGHPCDGTLPSGPRAMDPESASAHPLLEPGLYLVATPIGNLEDITLRALRVLRSVDRIACEDTRQTSKLLTHFGIRTPTVSYHTHNETSRASELIAALKSGGRIAVVSDAGTPGISDPGSAIAAEAIAAGVSVFPVPGANAALSALIASGLSAERFTFHGFLPSKEGQRRSTLEALYNQLHPHPARPPETAIPTAAAQIPGISPDPTTAPLNHAPVLQDLSPAPHHLPSGKAVCGPQIPPTTHIFYETPHRILDALADIAAAFGPHQRIALARELTKLHEEFLRGTAAELLANLRGRASIRGEFVLLIDGSYAAGPAAHPDAKPATLAEEVATLVRTAGLSEKDALKRVARSRNIGKSEAYRELQRSNARRP